MIRQLTVLTLLLERQYLNENLKVLRDRFNADIPVEIVSTDALQDPRLRCTIQFCVKLTTKRRNHWTGLRKWSCARDFSWRKSFSECRETAEDELRAARPKASNFWPETLRHTTLYATHYLPKKDVPFIFRHPLFLWS